MKSVLLSKCYQKLLLLLEIQGKGMQYIEREQILLVPFRVFVPRRIQLGIIFRTGMDMRKQAAWACSTEG